MYRFNVLLAFLFVLTASIAQENDNSFGKKIDADNAVSSSSMLDEYVKLNASDTLSTKFSAKVLDVCQTKGCWMRLELDNGEEAMVKFKDYGFFMPKDISGQEVIMEGYAFREFTSVDELRHYAEDAGKSAEEIAAITEPEEEFKFMASGVILVEKGKNMK